MQTARDEFEGALLRAADHWDLPIQDAQLELFRAHFDAVIEANKTMNLTRIVDPAEAGVKHYADALAILLWCRERHISATDPLLSSFSATTRAKSR